MAVDRQTKRHVQGRQLRQSCILGLEDQGAGDAPCRDEGV